MICLIILFLFFQFQKIISIIPSNAISSLKTHHIKDLCLINGQLCSSSLQTQKIFQWNTYAGKKKIIISPFNKCNVTEAWSNKSTCEKPSNISIVGLFPCVGNLFHLLFETLAPLYWLLKEINGDFQEFSDHPVEYIPAQGTAYDSITKAKSIAGHHITSCQGALYLPLMDELPIAKDYEHFQSEVSIERQTKCRLCFQNALIGHGENMSIGRISPAAIFVGKTYTIY